MSIWKSCLGAAIGMVASGVLTWLVLSKVLAPSPQPGAGEAEIRGQIWAFGLVLSLLVGAVGGAVVGAFWFGRRK